MRKWSTNKAPAKVVVVTCPSESSHTVYRPSVISKYILPGENSVSYIHLFLPYGVSPSRKWGVSPLDL